MTTTVVAAHRLLLVGLSKSALIGASARVVFATVSSDESLNRLMNQYRIVTGQHQASTPAGFARHVTADTCCTSSSIAMKAKAQLTIDIHRKARSRRTSHEGAD